MASFLDKLVKKFDSDKTVKFSDLQMLDPNKPWVYSGSPSLDLNMETFGFPIGIIEVRGESQSGKTTFALQAIKNCIQQYGDRAIVCILSSERRDNREYAQQMGIDVSRVIIHKITTVEEVMNRIFQTINKTKQAFDETLEEEYKASKEKMSLDEYKAKRTKEFGRLRYFFVWDSLGQTASVQELEKAQLNAEKDTTDKSALASFARALGGGLRSIAAFLDKEDLTLFIINRGYDKVDGQPGKESYGGKAIKFWPTLRLELARIQGVKVGEEELGQITQVSVIKSDFTRPKQKFEVEIAYGLGIVLSKEDIEFGIQQGILEKFGVGGAKFKVTATKELAWKTRKELYALYEKQEPMLKVLMNKLNRAVRDKIIQTKGISDVKTNPTTN